MSSVDDTSVATEGSNDEATEPGVPREHPRLAARFGDYVVLDVLGHGAMGLVYRAHDPRLDRVVALKIVLPGHAASEPAIARARLVAEARALARVSHPNVLAVYDVGERDDVVFVALELVDGVDLAQWLRDRPRAWRDVVAVFIEIAAGLAAVHDAGLVHRDVKPANVLVEAAYGSRSFGRVRVADFGIARETEERPLSLPASVDAEPDIETALTADGRVVGTPAYMAPEQHSGLEVGPAADQYALCVALYEALFGRRPFGGSPAVIAAAKCGPPRDPPSAAVPSWVWNIVVRGLQPLARDRFPSMAELRAALLADPARRRSRWVAAALVAAGVASAIALYVTRERPCTGAEQHRADVWSADRRQRIAEAFAQSDRSYARETWARVSDRIDAYADEWTAMYRDACETTRIRGEQPEAVLDRRLACLDTRRQRLAGMLNVLERAEADAVDHATELSAALEPIVRCREVEGGISLPATPALREQVADVRRLLADADALQTAGRYDGAATQAEAALHVARSIDYPPLLVEALALAGECDERLGDIEGARAALDEAMWSGLAIGHDEAVVRVVVMLAWIAGEHDRDLQAAESWAAHGRAILGRIGDPARPATQLYNALGAAYSNASRYEDALRSYELGLERAGDDPNLQLIAAAVHTNIGNVWRLRGDFERAHASYERALDLLEPRLGAEHPNVARTQVRIAQLLDVQGRPVQAVAALRRVIASLERTRNPSSDLAGALLDLGVALRHTGDFEESDAADRRALEMFETVGDDFGLAFALANSGETCVRRGIYDAAEAQLVRSIALLERIGGPQEPELAAVLLTLGSLREAQLLPEEAIALYERARDVAGDARAREATVALVSIAALRRGQRRFDDALAELDHADAIRATLPEPRADDRIVAATERVLVALDAGRVRESRGAVDALDDLLAEMRSRDTLRAFVAAGDAALARARMALDEPP